MISELNSLNITFEFLLTYYDFCENGVSASSQINLVHSQTNLITETCSLEVDGEIVNLLAEKCLSRLHTRNIPCYCPFLNSF